MATVTNPPSLLIAGLALLFTVASFWWIHARRGRMLCYPPLSYAAAFTKDRPTITLPLVIINTGPLPIIVLDFRLLIDSASSTKKSADNKDSNETEEAQSGTSNLPLTLSWGAVHEELQPRPDTKIEMPSPFSIEGRGVAERFIEFSRRSCYISPTNGPYTATVQVKAGHKSGWCDLLIFTLHTELANGGHRNFIARTNDPNWGK
ncbi:hypothetical protein [Amycolatopsis sp. 195334CR]|uniref:hypothetical protein n=1 Tax=Amycolatopsis sp. 195334CR TaxID=2814588 RepID=UPI001A8ECC26|nr:hypothetical protein [Amycolatopsis sp. 195334CR]MBN6037752.1 hypothetical protein [Amycolatopsis sp. 195334CR]